MNKIVEFGKKAWFVVRVLSGYEEKRIRAHRLELQKHTEQAIARKLELKRLSEQSIITEVRRMVEQMQELNKLLDETEKAIDEHLKPLDKNAHILIDMQMAKEEEHAKMIAEMAKQQYMMKKEMEMKQVAAGSNEATPPSDGSSQTANPETSKHAAMGK